MLSKVSAAFFGILVEEVLVEVMLEYGKDNSLSIIIGLFNTVLIKINTA